MTGFAGLTGELLDKINKIHRIAAEKGCREQPIPLGGSSSVGTPIFPPSATDLFVLASASVLACVLGG
jgi:hypothetical protein